MVRLFPVFLLLMHLLLMLMEALLSVFQVLLPMVLVPFLRHLFAFLLSFIVPCWKREERLMPGVLDPLKSEFVSSADIHIHKWHSRRAVACSLRRFLVASLANKYLHRHQNDNYLPNMHMTFRIGKIPFCWHLYL